MKDLLEKQFKEYIEETYNKKLNSQEMYNPDGKLYCLNDSKEYFYALVYRDQTRFFPSRSEQMLYTHYLKDFDGAPKFFSEFYWNGYTVSMVSYAKATHLEYEINSMDAAKREKVSTRTGRQFSDLHAITAQGCCCYYLDFCKAPVFSWKEYLKKWYDFLEVNIVSEKLISLHWIEKIRDIVNRNIEMMEEPPCFGLVHGQATLDNVLYAPSKRKNSTCIFNFSRSFFGDTDYDFIFLESEFVFHKGFKEPFLKEYTAETILHPGFREKLKVYKIVHQLENIYLAQFYHTEEKYRLDEHRDALGAIIS